MSDAKFIPGLFFKAPNEGAPDFVLAKGSIKIADMLQWLQRQEGEWVNFDLKESRDGKPYASVDNWRPQGQQSAPAPRGDTPRQNAPRPPQRAAHPKPAADFVDDDIPW